MDASEGASSTASSNHRLLASSSLDDCRFCGSKLNPAKLVVDLKTRAVTVRCDECKEVNVSGEIKKGTLPTEPVTQPLASKIEKPVFQCLFCPKTFFLNFGLKRHVLATHSSMVDPQTVGNVEILERETLPTASSVIQPSTSTKTTGKSVFHCLLCPKTFFLNSRLKKHILASHSFAVIRTTDGKTKKMLSEKACKLCGRAFRHRNSRIVHIRLNHPENNPSAGKVTKDRKKRIHTVKKPFVPCGMLCKVCKLCGRTFRHKNSRIVHIRLNHHGYYPSDRKEAENRNKRMHTTNTGGISPIKFPCNQCGKKFSRKETLFRHSLRMHTEDAPYRCKYCGKKFGDNNELSRHLMIHTGEKPFGCKDCGMKFRRNSHLKMHVTRTHEEKNPIKCKYCGRKCGANFELSRHLMIHTGEKPFGCKDCGMKFTRNSYLKMHVTRLHKD